MIQLEGVRDVFGYVGAHWQRILATTTAVCVALVSETGLVADPWHHYLVIGGVIGATILANQTPSYHPRDPSTGSYRLPPTP